MASKLRNFLKKSPLIRKLKWELEYFRGTWKFLDSANEDARYQVIIRFMKEYGNASPSILEMGCGEGLLLRKMTDFSYTAFRGVDLSRIAVRKAASQHYPNAAFEVGNMDSWTTASKFDLIVFNESIYFSNDPVALMAKYGQWLTPGGRMIVSIYIMEPTQVVVDKILRAYKPLAFQEVKNEMGTWQEYLFGF